MGQSTDGQICFGILFEEDYEFPWDLEPYNGDIEEWWTFGAQGFKHSFEIFGEDGNWLNGVKPSDEVREKYAKERHDFVNSHKKLPVELTNVCSDNCPIYILGIGYDISASRGYPEELDFSKFVVSNEQVKRLIDFCNEHGIKIDGEPKWYLSSYWG